MPLLFAYGKNRFSHDGAHIILSILNTKFDVKCVANIYKKKITHFLKSPIGNFIGNGREVTIFQKHIIRKFVMHQSHVTTAAMGPRNSRDRLFTVQGPQCLSNTVGTDIF